MRIFRSKQIAEIDAYTIKNEPISSIDLMERASLKLHDWIVERYNRERNLKIFVGPEIMEVMVWLWQEC